MGVGTVVRYLRSTLIQMIDSELTICCGRYTRHRRTWPGDFWLCVAQHDVAWVVRSLLAYTCWTIAEVMLSLHTPDRSLLRAIRSDVPPKTSLRKSRVSTAGMAADLLNVISQRFKIPQGAVPSDPRIFGDPAQHTHTRMETRMHRVWCGARTTHVCTVCKTALCHVTRPMDDSEQVFSFSCHVAYHVADTETGSRMNRDSKYFPGETEHAKQHKSEKAKKSAVWRSEERVRE
jgi:hypothetical protein